MKKLFRYNSRPRSPSSIMQSIVKLRESISHYFICGVVVALLISQVSSAAHFHADVVQDESCFACLLADTSPPLASSDITPSINVVATDFKAVLPKRNPWSAVNYDCLSRAPPLS